MRQKAQQAGGSVPPLGCSSETAAHGVIFPLDSGRARCLLTSEEASQALPTSISFIAAATSSFLALSADVACAIFSWAAGEGGQA